MLFKSVALAALASTAYGQSMASLTSVLSNQTSLSNLTTFLGQYPNLVATLGNLTNITLLAPNNAAFSKFLNTSTVTSLLTNQDLIQTILSYHVLNGTHSNFTNTSFVPTAVMPPTYANVTGGQVVEAVASSGNVSFVSGLLSRSSLANSTTLNFTGGVIHIIDQLLTLPENVSATAVALNLTSAYGALSAVNLLDTVDTTPDSTFFLPNNAAFQSIGSALGNLTTDQITSILNYHVVTGTVAYSTTLMNGTMVQTAAGQNVTIRVESDGSIFVNSARVVVPNVLVANGVIHVIDEVLNPGNLTAAPSGNATMGSPAFSGASSATNVPYTSGVPTPTSSIATESAVASGSGSGSGSSSSSSGGAWVPKATGAVEAAMLFGGAAVAMIW